MFLSGKSVDRFPWSNMTLLGSFDHEPRLQGKPMNGAFPLRLSVSKNVTYLAFQWDFPMHEWEFSMSRKQCRYIIMTVRPTTWGVLKAMWLHWFLMLFPVPMLADSLDISPLTLSPLFFGFHSLNGVRRFHIFHITLWPTQAIIAFVTPWLILFIFLTKVSWWFIRIYFSFLVSHTF